jgi:hypothetical protein
VAVRDTVRDTQRKIAALDAGHRRAVDQLKRACGRRAEALAEQDRLVASAQSGVDQAVAKMAEAIGVELAATLLSLKVPEVRRMTKGAGSGRATR